MPSILDAKSQRIVERWPTVIKKPCCLGQAANHIQGGDRFGALLDRNDFAQGLLSYLLEKLVFQLPGTLIGAEDLCFQFLQLRRDEALPADGSLFARVVGRHIGEVRFCNLDEITEDGV